MFATKQTVESTTRASLLTIPAELRNRVYEHVLLSEKRVDLNFKPNRKQPGLLSTCRQIRKETIETYYKGNDFKFTVHEYDGMNAKHAFKVVRKYRPNDAKAIIIELCEGCPTVHICKLHPWLKDYHADPKVPGLRQDSCIEETDEQTMARRTFGVVKAMRNKPWKDVEEVLGVFYRAIDMFEGGESEEELDDDDSDTDTDEDEDWSDEDDQEEESTDQESNSDSGVVVDDQAKAQHEGGEEAKGGEDDGVNET